MLNMHKKLREFLKNKDFRAISDLRNEKIGFKIREHTLRKVPYQLVVGEKEIESQKLSVRRRNGEDLGLMDLESFVSLLEKDVADKGRVVLANNIRRIMASGGAKKRLSIAR